MFLGFEYSDKLLSMSLISTVFHLGKELGTVSESAIVHTLGLLSVVEYSLPSMVVSFAPVSNPITTSRDGPVLFSVSFVLMVFGFNRY